MQRYKIGFHKAVQGSFTADRITEIKERLTTDYPIDLVEVDFRDGVLIDGAVYVGDVRLNDFDVYFWHDTLRPAESGADNYSIHLLRALQKDVTVINTAESTEITNDKLRAHDMLRAHGLPVSQYALVKSDDRDGIEKAFRALGGEVLIKPRFGGWGSGIVRCTTLEDLQSAIELIVTFTGKHVHVLLEKFYANNPSQWTSVSMIGQKVVAAYRKPLSLSGSDWKVYDPQKKDGKGQQSEAIIPTDEIRELAQKAQQAIGKSIIGFDFISTDEGPIIVDENGRPGLYAHCLDLLSVNLTGEIVGLITDTLSIDKIS